MDLFVGKSKWPDGATGALLLSVLHCRAMARFLSLQVGLVFLVAATGCDNSDRIARLEKQNQELQAQVKKTSAAAEYDLQSRCSNEARAWFNQNWSSDTNTLLLHFTNHYNKKLNKCFIIVENHRKNLYLSDGSWVNEITLTEVQENNQYGTFREDHEVILKPKYHVEEKTGDCAVNGKTCKSLNDFNQLSSEYMND